jgi:hypothetical protein
VDDAAIYPDAGTLRRIPKLGARFRRRLKYIVLKKGGDVLESSLLEGINPRGKRQGH